MFIFSMATMHSLPPWGPQRRMEYRTTSYISWLGISDGPGFKRVLEGTFYFVKSSKNEEK